MLSRKGFIHPVVLALALAAPSMALADKGGHGKGHGKGKAEKAHKHDDDRRVVVVERQPARVVVTRADMRFRGLDRNGDGVITRGEWRGNDQSFRVHDVNRDGILSGIEVRPAGLGGRGPRPSDRFLLLDRNRDSVLSLAEWSGSTLTFDRLDRNRDSLITRAEFFR